MIIKAIDAKAPDEKKSLFHSQQLSEHHLFETFFLFFCFLHLKMAIVINQWKQQLAHSKNT